jgi:DNA-binding XRE family transcriptional regulator
LILINAIGSGICKPAGARGTRVTQSQTRIDAEARLDRLSRAIPVGERSQAAEAEFLGVLGDRLRQMRSLRAISRRELARRSGISERYIAQIEAGKGNVSIMLLFRIANAMG